MLEECRWWVVGEWWVEDIEFWVIPVELLIILLFNQVV